MSNSSAYLRFLNLAQAVNSQWAGADVDLVALRLLEAVAIAHTADAPLTVTQAMALSAIASPATLHRKLDQLRESGLIEQTFEGDNRRTKYLITTTAAAKYFDQLGKALVIASQP
jgi:DNA-binding MarR family transcriptional regulator